MKCLLILLTFFLTQEALLVKKRPTAEGEPGSKRRNLAGHPQLLVVKVAQLL